MDRRKTKRTMHVALLATIAAAGSMGTQAGSLEPPPGVPAPTMKTLQDVEPRIPIHASDLPLTITQSGSYYLAEDAVFPAGGITISTSSVHLDLRGHLLAGTSGAGILAGTAVQRVVVENGAVTGWSGDGVDLSACYTCEVRRIHSSSNFGNGIRLGDAATVAESTVAYNGIDGIRVGSHGRVTGCVAISNQGIGISLNGGSVVRDSVAAFNTGSGIFAGAGSVVTGSIGRQNTQSGIETAIDSTVIGCTAAFNGLDGIRATTTLVKDSVADGNAWNGIRADAKSVVVGNAAINNGLVNRAAGILVTGNRARIDGNHATDNYYGIKVDGTQIVVVRNSAAANVSSNYSIGGGNDVGPIGTAATATSPWANLQF
jgi:hypothetical protein